MDQMQFLLMNQNQIQLMDDVIIKNHPYHVIKNVGTGEIIYGVFDI